MRKITQLEVKVEELLHPTTKIGKLSKEFLAEVVDVNFKLNERVKDLENLLCLSSPWPLPDILKRLTEAAEHLLHVHNCDHMGYEEISLCVEHGKSILRSWGGDNSV